jgi:hypothetical protein
LQAQGGGAFHFRYDGKSIREFISDAIRDISGYISVYNNLLFHETDTWKDAMAVLTNTYALWSYPLMRSSVAENTGYSNIAFNASHVVPTALENRPASISYYPCIKY